MKNNRLTNFLGKTNSFNGIPVYTPTINEIEEIGEMTYSVFTTMATFDKESILKTLLGVSDEGYKDVEKEDSYEVITCSDSIVAHTLEAISFFLKQEVRFNKNTHSYVINDLGFLDRDIVIIDRSNYQEFSRLIKEINCIADQKDELKFKNDRVKQKYQEMLKEKSKHEKTKDTGLELKDMLSILCSAEGNGINIFNCGQLKIYQVYEQFERVNVRENHIRTLKLWANTFTLKEGTKLPEWIIRTKL